VLKTRVIPCLLLRDGALVKTTRFRDPKYIGDPINAIRIFNDKEVDELVLLDIEATLNGRGPAYTTIEEVASECFMPLAYGGGVRSVDDARRILRMGVEKIVFNSAAWRDPTLLTRAADAFGSQAVVASIDARRKLFGGHEVYVDGGRKATGMAPADLARRFEASGAGELLLSSIDRDGTLKGYDVDLVASVAKAVQIPVVASGGAGRVEDFRAAVTEGGAAAVAAGAMFVFHGPHRAVLITYPQRHELQRVLG
jgi:cyclase